MTAETSTFPGYPSAHRSVSSFVPLAPILRKGCFAMTGKLLIEKPSPLQREAGDEFNILYPVVVYEVDEKSISYRK